MKIFGTIIDQQYYAQSFLKNNLTSSKPDNKKIENEVVKEIITRAQIFLDNNLPLVKESWDNIGIVDQKYTEFSKAAFLFATTFKIASEKEGVEFSDIKNTSYEIRLPDSLTEADKVRMEGMFIRNRVSYKKELLKETLEDLRSAINGEKQSLFYMLEHDKELVAYMRFDPIEPGRVYAGSLNVRDEARGSRLGSAMLQATLEEQGLTADIEAVAYSKNPMLKHYIDDFGFEIVGEIPDYHGTGELFYKLLRKKKQAVPAKSYTKTP